MAKVSAPACLVMLLSSHGFDTLLCAGTSSCLCALSLPASQWMQMGSDAVCSYQAVWLQAETCRFAVSAMFSAVAEIICPTHPPLLLGYLTVSPTGTGGIGCMTFWSCWISRVAVVQHCAASIQQGVVCSVLPMVWALVGGAFKESLLGLVLPHPPTPLLVLWGRTGTNCWVFLHQCSVCFGCWEQPVGAFRQLVLPSTVQAVLHYTHC